MSDSRTASSQSLNGSDWRRCLRVQPCALVFLALVVIFAFPGGSVAGNGKGPVKSAPVSTAPPTISGSPVVGQTLTASTGSWRGQVSSYAYQWVHCDSSGACSKLSGATSSSYKPVSGDVGYSLRVSVTASNRYGSSVATSSATAAVTAAPTASAPTNMSSPTISGTTTVGQNLSSSTGTWSGSPTSYAFQWEDCDSSGASCVKISGATSSSYALQSGDAGKALRAVVTATNSGGSSSATSAQTSLVASTTSTTGGYPASFYSGPAGTNILLPPNDGYPAKGAWIGEASGNGLTQVQSREQYLGRKFNIYAYYAQNRCDPYPSILADVVSSGHIPLISWYPTPTYADQIISGQADSCIKSFGNAIANQPAKFFFVPMWNLTAVGRLFRRIQMVRAPPRIKRSRCGSTQSTSSVPRTSSRRPPSFGVHTRATTTTATRGTIRLRIPAIATWTGSPRTSTTTTCRRPGAASKGLAGATFDRCLLTATMRRPTPRAVSSTRSGAGSRSWSLRLARSRTRIPQDARASG